MKFRHCLLKILENQNVANGQMETLMDGCEKSNPPLPHMHSLRGGIMKKKISFCFQKSFSKTQINMKMQKPTFPILSRIRLKMLLLLKERKKEKKKGLAKITHVSLRTSNCGEIAIAYHVYMLTQGQAHFN